MGADAVELHGDVGVRQRDNRPAKFRNRLLPTTAQDFSEAEVNNFSKSVEHVIKQQQLVEGLASEATVAFFLMSCDVGDRGSLQNW